MKKRTQNVRDQSEHCVTRTVLQGTVAKKQKHRGQKAHKRGKQPQKAEPIPHAIPRGNRDREQRQSNKEDRQREGLRIIIRVDHLTNAEPNARRPHVHTRQHNDSHPRCSCRPPHTINITEQRR